RIPPHASEVRSLLSLSEFLRSTPAKALRSYFDHRRLTLPDTCPWQGTSRVLSTALLAAIDGFSEHDRSLVIDDAQRLGTMADGSGQEALDSVVDEDTVDLLDALENGYARAVWTFLNAPAQ